MGDVCFYHSYGFMPWFLGVLYHLRVDFFSHAKEETGIGRHLHHAGVGHFKCKHLGLWT